MALLEFDGGQGHLFLYIDSRLYTIVSNNNSLDQIISVAGQCLRRPGLCLSPGFLSLWLLHERDISPESLSQQRGYTPGYVQRYVRAVLISNVYVRIQTQTTCKPQLEQRSSKALNFFSLPP